MTLLARSARWATWFNVWLDGHAPVDDAVAAVSGDDAAHDVIGLAEQPLPLLRAWLALRERGARLATVALPVAGDPVGLAGPASFNEQAIHAGEAVIIDGVGIGLVPSVVGRGVFWSATEAISPPPSSPVSEAELALREQLIDAARELTDLDVARWRPEIADALSDLRSARDRVLPPGYGERAERVAALATRCLHIGELALTDDGNAITRYETDARRRITVDLTRAARHAVVVACSDRKSR
ncbi:MAG: hypothetical protein L0K86_13625 [Actinomycetia bacterium]|nr:hypothetical protein [Actinomycetes bacterium]